MERSDTLVKTLRQEWGDNFAAGYRADTNSERSSSVRELILWTNSEGNVDAPCISAKAVAAEVYFFARSAGGKKRLGGPSYPHSHSVAYVGARLATLGVDNGV
jgi:hypothetical protein